MELHELIEFTQHLNVLFIEDDDSFRAETFDIFDILFNKVDLAVNGEDGLEQYNEFYIKHHYHYDLVVSDVNMPMMDGETLISKIKNIHENQNVVIISAHTESQTLLKFIKLGIKDFLVKPISSKELNHCLYNVTKKIYRDRQQDQHFVGDEDLVHKLLSVDEYIIE